MAIYTGTNLNTLKSGLDTTLDTLQAAIDRQVLGNSLPLLGDTLKDNNAAKFITKIKAAFDVELSKLTNPTVEDLQQALQTAATNLGIFKNIQASDSATEIRYVLRLGQDPIDVSTPLASNIGLPNLGLKIEGNANTKLGYDFTLGFGLDKDKGFFFDTSKDDLDLKLGVTTPGLNAKTSLGFLQFNGKDAGTSFNGDFAIDLKSSQADPLLFLPDLAAIGTNYQNLVDAKLTGNADIKFNLGATTGIKGLPSVSTDLGIKWNFNGLTSLDYTNPGNFGDAPTINFDNITLDAGAAISDFSLRELLLISLKQISTVPSNFSASLTISSS
jgi:hypothetical protein